MKLNNLIQGLQILQKYYNKPDGYKTCAEHDVIYAHSTDKPLSEEDFKKMYKLGWFQENTDSEEPKYFEEEGWQAFT